MFRERTLVIAHSRLRERPQKLKTLQAVATSKRFWEKTWVSDFFFQAGDIFKSPLYHASHSQPPTYVIDSL